MKPRRAPRPRPKSRAEFVQRESEVWQEMAAAWVGLPDTALIEPGAGGPEWSVKDVHIYELTEFLAKRQASA